MELQETLPKPEIASTRPQHIAHNQSLYSLDAWAFWESVDLQMDLLEFITLLGIITFRLHCRCAHMRNRAHRVQAAGRIEHLATLGDCPEVMAPGAPDSSEKKRIEREG